MNEDHPAISAAAAPARTPKAPSPPSQTVGLLSWSLSAVRPHLWLAAAVLLLSVAVTAISLVNPLILRFLIDDVLLTRDADLLGRFIAFLGALTLLYAALRISTFYLNRALQVRIAFDVRNRLFEHLERIGVGFLERYKLGDVVSRLDVDVLAFEQLSGLTVSLALSLMAMGGIFFILFYFDWRLMAIVTAILPLYVASQRFFVRRIHRLYELVRIFSADLTSYITEKLAAIGIITLFGQEAAELRREKRFGSRIRSAELRAGLVDSLAAASVSLVTATTLLVILWYGGLLAVRGEMSIGTLIAVYTYVGFLFSPVEALVSFWREAQEPLVSIGRIKELMDLSPRVREDADAASLPEAKGRVTFKNVSFGYEGKPMLRRLSFDVSPGQRVGIVGRSGAGKTTIANLLVRFYDPDEGRILIDRTDIRTVTLSSLRRAVGFLQQEPILFRTSIRENIAYGKPGADLAEIRRAAKRAGADDFIRRLPNGYRTNLGTMGEGLSAGERQRIALARLFLRGPRILILDEVTAFLDAITQRKVRREIDSFIRERTVFFISHDLRTLKRMDTIIALGDGEAEQGTFGELLDRKGTFADIYQAGET